MMISPPKSPRQHKTKGSYRRERSPSQHRRGGSGEESLCATTATSTHSVGHGAEDILGLGRGGFVDAEDAPQTSNVGRPSPRRRQRSRSRRARSDSADSNSDSQSNATNNLSPKSAKVKGRTARSSSAYGERESREQSTLLLSPTSAASKTRANRSRSTGERDDADAGESNANASGGQRRRRRRAKSTDPKDGGDGHHRSRSHKLPESHQRDLEVRIENRRRSRSRRSTVGPKSAANASPLRTGKSHFLAMPDDEQLGGNRRKSETLEVLSIMKLGTPMLKNGKWGFPHFRQFQLSDDASKIVWFTAGKKISKTSVSIASVEQIVYGQATDNFRRYPNAAMEHLSFSLLHSSHSKTLDLTCKSQRDFDLWTKGLEKLLENEKQRVVGIGGPQKLEEVHVEVVDATADELHKVRRRTSGATAPQGRQLDSPHNTAKQLEKERQEMIKKVRKLEILVDKKRVTDNDTRERLVKLDKDVETCGETIHAEDFGVARHLMWEVNIELESLENKVKAIYS